MSTLPATNKMHRPSARALTFWALCLSVLTVITVPIIVGYFFGTVAVALAAIVIGRSIQGEYQWTTWGAWMAALLSIGAMVGHLVYMMGFAKNYM